MEFKFVRSNHRHTACKLTTRRKKYRNRAYLYIIFTLVWRLRGGHECTSPSTHPWPTPWLISNFTLKMFATSVDIKRSFEVISRTSFHSGKASTPPITGHLSSWPFCLGLLPSPQKRKEKKLTKRPSALCFTKHVSGFLSAPCVYENADVLEHQENGSYSGETLFC